ncbi:aspartate aminotransferase, chloroplastic-like isoform X1 [Phoenix dactylifera]|uniref:Aspartate aminotransferase n=2 Tax=Phoenix dactylifera TaxID=42345 RepID=A0A8B9AAR8_PHODC|nr:aspartate aminotransferase, chloroplastic-like isoform X1 [Phoenix dactylifera]
MASEMVPLALSPSTIVIREHPKSIRVGKRTGSLLFKAKAFGPNSTVVAPNGSRFEGVTSGPPDPYYELLEAFEADTSDTKVNLWVRAYRVELQPFVLNVVKKAEKLMLEKGEDKEYLPMDGLAEFNKVTAELLFGANNPVIQEGRVATVQALSGTGALHLAAAFIHGNFPNAKALISSPTWSNHKTIFDDAKVPYSEYRHYDPISKQLDFDGMIADIKAAPHGSFVLLHGCAHNPTGMDPTPDQWGKIADIIQEKNHIPFFDVAYQGFASGNLDADAYAVRLFVERGLELLVAQSYGKNLGLYGERIGAINIVCSSSETAVRVKSQLKWLIRPEYSNPPLHGARIVANVVGDPALFNEWKQEVELISRRLKSLRQRLFESLSCKDRSGRDWSFIVKENGIFSLIGLNKAQISNPHGSAYQIAHALAVSVFLILHAFWYVLHCVFVRLSQIDNMRNKWHVYMIKDGRMSLGGLSLSQCEYLADAIRDSFHNVS